MNDEVSEPIASVPTDTPEPVVDAVSPVETAQAPEPTAQVPANEPLPTVAPPIVSHPPSLARDLLARARAALQSRRDKKLARILVLLEAKKSITNDDVEKLLHVSDATATRYLQLLEREGKVAQVGKEGRAVTYTKIG